MPTKKNMSGGVKLGYIDATANELATSMLAFDLEDGTEQSDHCSRTVRMKQKTGITTCGDCLETTSVVSIKVGASSDRTCRQTGYHDRLQRCTLFFSHTGILTTAATATPATTCTKWMTAIENKAHLEKLALIATHRLVNGILLGRSQSFGRSPSNTSGLSRPLARSRSRRRLETWMNNCFPIFERRVADFAPLNPFESPASCPYHTALAALRLSVGAVVFVARVG